MCDIKFKQKQKRNFYIFSVVQIININMILKLAHH